MDPQNLQPTAPVIGAAKMLAAAQQRPGSPPQSRWADLVAANPEHSRWYIERFRSMAAAGADLVGEARLVDAMAPRQATILDAGCGPGRHAGYLHRAGHTVVGIDLDPALITEAASAEPGPAYLVGDLATVRIPDDLPQQFDLLLCAGNVMTFLHPDTRVSVLAQFQRWLAVEGRAVVGFGRDRGYSPSDFDADVRAAGLTIVDRHASWDLRPSTPESSFDVSIIARA
ncbi:MAG: class I SAM-dependent methyltransferase [Propioniciclava sp.]